MAVFTLIASLVTMFALTQAAYDIVPPIPVSSPEPGIRYNPSGYTTPAKVTMEVFMNLMCHHFEIHWPVIKELEAYYGPLINVIVNAYSLSNYAYSHLATEGFYTVNAYDQANLWNYFERVNANRTIFAWTATADETEYQALDKLAVIVEETTDITADFFKANIYNFDQQARNDGWKYGVKRGSAGNTWFIINGVNLELNPHVELTFEDWKAFLDPIINASKKQ